MRPDLLVVHCVDAEGPLGGDARRNPDGTREFYDNWQDIQASLQVLTSPVYRQGLQDSYGRPYRFTWCCMDFVGFKTNPKHRDITPFAVYDLLKSLPTELDEFGFHYHIPPETGEGDVWADRWDPRWADVQLDRLACRRGHKPRVFRAGGTIEFDGPMNRWLEDRFSIDFSNRVSERSTGEGGLESFDWHGAPETWRGYHPSQENFKAEGGMRRTIYRCIDAESRYNRLGVGHIAEACREAIRTGYAVLSFFSHDNREMRPETERAVRLIRQTTYLMGVNWRVCTGSEAHALRP